MPHIYFIVTNDLSYDQRMQRICSSLSDNGYEVTLVGRHLKKSLPISKESYRQQRLHCVFNEGKIFYAEYNLRLFFYLLFKKMDGICAIDLDTIIPCLLISKLKNIKRIYDAHELFCEMKEVVTRPRVYKIWKSIERKTVPEFRLGYTVNQQIADEFAKMYGSRYEVIRSISRYDASLKPVKEKFILYQGAVNEGRSFETLIPAMQWVDVPLHICGTGNFFDEAKQLVNKYGLENKVIFHGMLEPHSLRSFSNKAYVGITLFEKDSLSNYYSLANRFFDYIHAGTPQLCVDYPVYREINNLHNIAVLINDLSPENIAKELNSLLLDGVRWNNLHANCELAALQLNWQKEEKVLLSFYKKIFG